MIGANEFGADFQRLLVRLCTDDFGTRALVARFLQAGQLGWTDPTARWAWGIVASEERGVSRLRLETEAGRLAPADPARLGLFALLNPASDARDLQYVRDQVIEWARRQTFRLAYDEAAAAWNRGDVDTAQATMLRRIEEIQAMRLDIADRGWFFEELDDRQSYRYSRGDAGEVFPSGIEKLDRAMNGGLQRGQLEIPLAYSGIGKTFWCVHRGYIAAKLRSRVLHFALEGGRKKTEDRYEARFTETLFKEVRVGNIEMDTFMDARAEYDTLRKGLIIRGTGDRAAWSFAYDDILGELTELRRAFGWVPDMIVVDYGDLLAEAGETPLERQTLGYRKLKHLSERIGDSPGQHGYAVVSPSQAQRPDKGADEREHVLRPRDVADCYEKVRAADVVLSLNRTLAEQEAEQARVALGKYRDDEDGMVVRVTTDYARGGFCLLYAPEPEPPDPPEPKTKTKTRKAAVAPAPPPAPMIPPVSPGPPPPAPRTAP